MRVKHFIIQDPENDFQRVSHLRVEHESSETTNMITFETNYIKLNNI